MRILILSVIFGAGALASVPIRDGCSEDAAIVARVEDNDPIQVRHAVIGETVPCYAVSVHQEGRDVQGFALGSTLRAIQAFEQTRELDSRVVIPAPAPPAPAPSADKVQQRPKGSPLQPSLHASFQAWSGVDTRGKPVKIVPADAKVTLVTFWNCESRPAREFAQSLMKTESQFRAKGLRAFGFVEARSRERADYYLDDMGLDYTQTLDRQRLAGIYGADPQKGTTLVIDAANNIVAVSSNREAIRAAIESVLSPAHD